MRPCQTPRLLAGLVMFAITGCGSSPPPLAPVQGLVTFRGLPLASGLIVFTPDEESGHHGPVALGVIHADGRFVLMTDAERGAALGRHRVTIAGPPGFDWPAHLLDPLLSGLQADVLPGENKIDFQLP